MSKVHYTINPPCRVSKRWGSCQITSTKNRANVTCKNCLNLIRKSEGAAAREQIPQ